MILPVQQVMYSVCHAVLVSCYQLGVPNSRMPTVGSASTMCLMYCTILITEALVTSDKDVNCVSRSVYVYICEQNN